MLPHDLRPLRSHVFPTCSSRGCRTARARRSHQDQLTSAETWFGPVFNNTQTRLSQNITCGIPNTIRKTKPCPTLLWNPFRWTGLLFLYQTQMWNHTYTQDAMRFTVALSNTTYEKILYAVWLRFSALSHESNLNSKCQCCLPLLALQINAALSESPWQRQCNSQRGYDTYCNHLCKHENNKTQPPPQVRMQFA